MQLVVVDTVQIQPYIFGTNRLRESVGASYLVDMATGDWALRAVREAAPQRTNLGRGDVLLDEMRMEQGLEAEVLYAGGGNIVVLFDHIDRVKTFQTSLSRRVLEEAPGLQLVIALQEIDWRRQSLSEKLNEVWEKLAVQKRAGARPAPLLGLSVTAACHSTGLPATGIVKGIRGEPGYLASDEVRAKVDVARRRNSRKSLADQRLQQITGLPELYGYPADFEDLGGTPGEYSYIAVVHADGDGVGQCIVQLCDEYRAVERNREFIQALRSFSREVQQAARSALQRMRARLVQSICRGEDGEYSIRYQADPQNRGRTLILKLTKDKDGTPFVPFRPVVYGGDDVTFVCDGRLGLTLATLYLQEFQRQPVAYLAKNKKRLTASAGIAIIKSHYPFARAYELATDLIRSAKGYRRSQGLSDACLDWHFAMSGLGASIEEIRRREYRVEEGSLTLRPLTLQANCREAERAWPVILQGIEAFQKKHWAERRNKIKALREALRGGKDAVTHFLVAFNDRDPLPEVLSNRDDWQKTGWYGEVCGYFDAIELADWFLQLKGEMDETPTALSAPGK